MKAILVIDTPSRCGDCRLADFGKCWGSNSYLHLSTKDRPKECPLRPLPKKKDTDMSLNAMNDWLEHSERIGFNRCIDEILGEKE